ncbi:MAG: phosphoribosylamine--glycine ligase [Sumerlaeia bacterium]
MKILLIGGGGREHAIAWRLKASPSVTRIVCPNGNPGIAREAETPRAELASPVAWAEYGAEMGADLVVIGPEQPLAEGVADACEAKGLRVFGPTKAGAEIEASKAFAKDIMVSAGIPTAASETFSDATRALDFAKSLGGRCVVKADGLAAGKGVAMCETLDDARAAIEENLTGHRFGASSARIVIEEWLEGEEVSILALTDGEEVFPLVPSQDHKRAGEGDTGLNTGGMGAYAPVPWFGEEYLTSALSMVLRPAIAELRRRGIPYKGVLYAGLMVTKDGPKVLEFNCRFGDPETQVVLPLFEGDLGETMLACAEGRLGKILLPPHWQEGNAQTIGMRPDNAVVVVMASEGYPGTVRDGQPIHGLDAADGLSNAMIFHAGTTAGPNGEVLTKGGRVLGLTAWGRTLQSSLSTVYDLAGRVSFDGGWLRRDIAHRALGK